MIEVLEIIFRYQKEFFNDRIFNNLKQQFLLLIKTLAISRFQIFLGDGYQSEEKLKNVGYISFESKMGTNSFRIFVDGIDHSYTLEINGSKIVLDGYFCDDNLCFNYESFVYDRDEHNLIKITKKINSNDYYLDYDVLVYNTDELGNVISLDFLASNQKFSQLFGIPIEKVQMYRANFQENIEFLNESKIRKEMEFEDNNLNSERLFTAPFNIRDFELFLGLTFTKDEASFYNAIENGYSLEDLAEAKRRVDYLKRMLAAHVGTDGEIVLENNLVTNINNYVYNSSVDFLCTRGIVLKKVNGAFFMVFVVLENNQITSFRRKLDKEEAQEYYFKNSSNAQNEGLKEFFEIEKNRS